MPYLNKNNPVKLTHYNYIDFCKLFFSVCIVAIHTDLLCNMKGIGQWVILNGVFRLGVPYFYTVSGFFLSLKVLECGDVKNTFCKYRKKLVKPLLILGSGGLVFFIIDLIEQKLVFWKILLKCLQTIIFYPRAGMWFLLALIVSSYILQFVIEHKTNRVIVTLLSLMLYFVSVMISSMYYLIEQVQPLKQLADMYLKIFISGRNGIFLFIFMWIGYLLATKEIKVLYNRHKTFDWVILIVGLILLFIEINLSYLKIISDNSSVFLSYLLVIPAFVILNIVLDKTTFKITSSLRRVSIAIYFYHSLVYMFNIHFVKSIHWGTELFIITLLETIMIYLVVEVIRKTIGGVNTTPRFPLFGESIPFFYSISINLCFPSEVMGMESRITIQKKRLNLGGV